MLTIDEIWVLFLIGTSIIATPFFLKRIVFDYRTKGALSNKSVVLVWAFFGVHFMTIANTALYTPRWAFASGNPICTILGLVLMGFGVFIFVAALYEFRSFKRLSGLKADKVISTGVYRYSRNPQYLAIFSFLEGLAWQYRSLAALALVAVSFLLVNSFIVPGEERYLEKMLSEEFTRYKETVRRWL